MKKINTIFVTLVLLFSMIFTVPTYAQSPVRLNVNRVFCEEYRPVIKNGTTLVPLAFIAQKLNLQVNWNQKQKKVTIQGDKQISLFIGETTAYIGTKTKNMPVSPQIIQGKTYVPVAFIADLFHIPVNWDGKNKIVTIGQQNTPSNDTTENYEERIKGNLSSKVIMYPQQNTQSSDVEVDLFHKHGKATLEVGKVMNSVDVALYWYSINTNLELGFDHVDFYQNGVLAPNATLQAATVDLDKDGKDEIIVAVHDGVIDGVFSVLQPFNSLNVGDGVVIDTLYNKVLGTEYFQRDIIVEKNGHIITPIGSQGLFSEYVLQNGKLVEVPTYITK